MNKQLREAATMLCQAIRDHHNGGPMNEQIAENLRDTESALVDTELQPSSLRSTYTCPVCSGIYTREQLEQLRK